MVQAPPNLFAMPARPALRTWRAGEGGGRRRIRTFEGVSQQIYSLPPLATWVSYHFCEERRRREAVTACFRACVGLPTPVGKSEDTEVVRDVNLWLLTLQRDPILFVRDAERHHRPTRGGGGDPGIAAVRESAIHGGLKWKRAAADMPDPAG